MKNWITISFVLLLGFGGFSQSNTFILESTLQWNTPLEVQSEKVLSFEKANYDMEHSTLPLVIETIPLATYGQLNVVIEEVNYEPLDKDAHPDDAFLSNTLTIQSTVDIARRKAIGQVRFIPIRKTATGYERVTSYRLKVTVRPEAMPIAVNSRTGSNSILIDGDIYKIAVAKTGVYKLTYNFLKDSLGIDVDNINPQTIKIYGNGGGMLPESNSVARFNDLEENAIQIVGEADGKFDANDYILFYGESPNEWLFDKTNQKFYNKMHYFDKKNHYFIKISSGNGKRIADQTSQSGATYSTNSYNFYTHHEEDQSNLLNDFVYASASGKEWYGESFKFTTERDFDFNIPNIITSEAVDATVKVASRSIGVSNSFNIFANGQGIFNMSLNGVNGDTESYFAFNKTTSSTFLATNSNVTIRLRYNKPTSDSNGWLDYITLNARSGLNFSSGQMGFRDIKSIGEAVTEFSLTASNSTIWNVTNPTDVSNQLFSTNGNTLSFGANTTSLEEFIIFDNTSFLTAQKVGKIANQNLHGGLPAPDLVVLYHSKFLAQAKRLAEHRSNFSDMTVSLVELEQVYNEFSSGNTDISAIRDFAKYLYEEYPNFNYLLLFGDGSFDYKNITNNSANHNYIPVYETNMSVHPIRSYASDDYYGLLDPNEGAINSGKLDIAIGRLPVQTLEEAKNVVDKIIRYDTDPVILGDWKNRITFAADDEDGNLHMTDADGIANLTQNANPSLNLDKIYFDAYPQVSTHGGNRFPAVTEAIHSNMFKGNFVVNYMGHGGDEGWAQERVLQIPHIQSWSNQNKLPLFVTATCSFAPYDDPSVNSAGEIILLKPDGGSVALFTTVRAVYTSSNRLLTTSVFNNLFKSVNGKIPPMGEILRHAKVTSGANAENSRKFTMLGDPAQTLAYPKYKVVTTRINGNPVALSDTVSALEQVTIEGMIADVDSSILNSFNGVIYPTVYDKRLVYTTLGQDAASSPKNYTMQKTILFKGRASVTNGRFKFSFVIPKDINYNFGAGKISYYADNGADADASGVFTNIVIGGTSPTALEDNEGPKVEVYMNNDEFVFGGITDESPTVYVKLEDDNGINTTGTGIGHDLTGVLDDNTQNTYIFNDFYESELDNFKKGEVRYPLSNLEEGRHKITVKAWDVSNNSGEGSTEFVVASSANIALDHVLNYPNPFTTKTEFQFEHNLPDQPLVVQVQIFTVSGRLVKTIQEDVQADGYRVTGIEWNGTDDYGNRIGRGVYVYKVSIGTSAGEGNMASESQFEKLVILK